MVLVVRRGPRPMMTGLLVGGAVAGRQQQKKQQEQQQAAIEKANKSAEEAKLEAEKAKKEAEEAKKEAGKKHDDEVVQVLITVPAGVTAGQPFAVQYEGQSYNITCPAGVAAGQNITVNFPKPKPVVVVAQAATPVVQAEDTIEDEKTSVEAVSLAPSFEPDTVIYLEVFRDHIVDETSPSMKQFGILSIASGEQVTLVEGDLTSGLGGNFKDYIRVEHNGRTGLISKHVVQPAMSVPPAEFAPPPAIGQ